MNQPPAFQFYPDNFRDGCADMEQSEIGAYMLLLCYQWGHGSIPSEKARMERAAYGPVSDHVLKKFRLCEDGQLRNERMEKEREKQAEYRAQQSAKGKASAQARFNRGSTVVQPSGQPKPNSPSPSPSPSPISATDTVSQTPKPPPTTDASHPWEGDWKRLGKLFRRRESTLPTPKEMKALKAITPIPAEDFKLIESYYNFPHPPAADYRRRDLQTLLNNWPGELDRARRFKPSSGAISTIPGEHESILAGIKILQH